MAPSADPPYIDGPSRPIAPPEPSDTTAAAMRDTNARNRNGYSESWKLRKYSSDVAGDAPPPKYFRISDDPIRPSVGTIRPHLQSASSSAWKSSSTTTYSKYRTNTPVIAPVTAASNTTSRDRLTR